MPRGKTQKNLNLIEACYHILAVIAPTSVRDIPLSLLTQFRAYSPTTRQSSRVIRSWS